MDTRVGAWMETTVSSRQLLPSCDCKLYWPLSRFLSKLECMWPEVPGILHPVLQCLEKFRVVVKGCFSWELVADYKQKIEEFTESYSWLMKYAEVHC